VAEAELHRRRAGRPRLRPAGDTEVAPRAEILDAAAELFVSQGLAATTTRQIADRVGIRQASLYYYFAGKDEILLELLTQSVRPSLEVAATLESRCRDDPAAGLYALALIDVATLVLAPHNIATLYLMPEVQAEEFGSFRAERAQLQAVYGRLGQAASANHGMDEALTATLLMQLVESVIQLRRTGELREGYGHEIAAACLRLVGLSPAEVARARAAADLVHLAPHHRRCIREVRCRQCQLAVQESGGCLGGLGDLCLAVVEVGVPAGVEPGDLFAAGLAFAERLGQFR
jgi:AcrR family transcriptional regulator